MGAGMRCSLPAALLVSALLLAIPVHSVVVSGGDTSYYQQKPLNGAPWRQIAGIAGPIGSGVYLGKRFIITANHVPNIGTVVLDGVEYQRDPSFVPVQLAQRDVRHPVGQAVDAQLFRILGDPGIPGVPLIAPGDNDLAKRCTYVGWGRGRGDAFGSRGWHWNDIRVKRWGTNITLPYTFTPANEPPVLLTRFDRTAGPDEMSLANTDSGGGLFINFGGTWKLAGIGVDVDGKTDDSDPLDTAFYDSDVTKPGDQASKSYYVRLRPLRVAILSIINAAAP